MILAPMAEGEGTSWAGIGVTVACTAWFLGAMVIAIEVFDAEPRRSNLWTVVLIFVAPVVVFLLGRELMLRVKDGPRAPGRHRSDR